ncbi:hypothetical protein [Ralstonia solanacearum]|uniref:hypothetical protein n=1 Tax=Ralstonia solanacearum TaxID=305 RepID=UPI000A632CF1|nr:hypothetical protein [Ralstonia solanacearum]MBB6585235.1 hypothetical protein [Ralstonia solanacearum]MCG3574296.1 hypothetical protein [Ralstonia solanacearum]MCL9825469.1 hypothetical protein [Ralstonia solanacearum]MCL9830654.1 hypothetical protein [Ralstonia solanacearum]MCL9835435.1 hypothetical protein [Ralstonia solanacearum]
MSLLLAELPDFRCTLQVDSIPAGDGPSVLRDPAARGASALLDCVYGEVLALDGMGRRAFRPANMEFVLRNRFWGFSLNN